MTQSKSIMGKEATTPPVGSRSNDDDAIIDNPTLDNTARDDVIIVVVDDEVSNIEGGDMKNAQTSSQQKEHDAGDSNNSDDGTVMDGSVGSNYDKGELEVARNSRPSTTANGKHVLYAFLVVGLVAVLTLGLGLGLGLNQDNNGRSSVSSSSSNTFASVEEGNNASSGSSNDVTTSIPGTVATTTAPGGGVSDDPAVVNATASPTEAETGEKDTALIDKFDDDAMEWPQLVGMDGDLAASLLEKAYPGWYDIVILLEGSIVSMDYVLDRIRIFVNDDNIVTLVPRVG